MKISVKSVFGVMISIAWLVVYVGGGALFLARQAIKNPDSVPAYIPFVIFLWIVGFFVGHVAIEKFFLIFLRSNKTNLVACQHLQTLDIDNLPIPNRTVYKKYPENFFKYPSRHNCNAKKDTGKIINFSKPATSIYKIVQHC
jgi:hypothetical protein